MSESQAIQYDFLICRIEHSHACAGRDTPYTSDGRPSPAGGFANRGLGGGRRREDQFVIVSPGQDQTREIRFSADNSPRRGAERQVAELYFGRHARYGTDMSEIGDEPVGDIGGGAGHPT